MNLKKCNKCQDIKPISEYYTSYGKYHNECKLCWKIRARDYEDWQRLLNSIHINTDGIKKCNKCGKTKDIKEFLKSSRRKGGYANICVACHNIESKNSRDKNREKNNARTRAYNKEHYKEYFDRKAKSQRKRNAQRRPADLIHQSIRSKVRRQLNTGKGGKRTFALVGYTPEQLIMHLEKQFKPGMSWGNYGQWHIDHIIPKAAFNIKSYEDFDFKRCWDLNNLQPLWAEENYKKRDKLEKPFQPSLSFLQNSIGCTI